MTCHDHLGSLLGSQIRRLLEKVTPLCFFSEIIPRGKASEYAYCNMLAPDCRRAWDRGDPEHLAHIHLWALSLEVPQFSADLPVPRSSSLDLHGTLRRNMLVGLERDFIWLWHITGLLESREIVKQETPHVWQWGQSRVSAVNREVWNGR